jgi:hypothetical protein
MATMSLAIVVGRQQWNKPTIRDKQIAMPLISEWARTETPGRAKRELEMLRTGIWIAK